jgi:GT2 family glycosyltransferase
MKFSVIIPTCSRNESLTKCLDCLLPETQEMGMNSYEIIVTDDGKENQAMDLIEEKYPWVKWVEGPKRGPAANRNNGAKYAKGEWLLFTDDDCLPAKNWIKAYLNSIKDNSQKFVFEGYTNADRPKKRFDEEAPINITGGNLWSCNFCIEKNFFFKVGGFDENFPYAAMEDIDFMIRVNKLEKIEFIESAVVIHPWRRTKPFKGLKKYFISFRYFRIKNIENIHQYRISRIKIFISSIYGLTNELVKYSFKGVLFYFEKILLNFILIFS